MTVKFPKKRGDFLKRNLHQLPLSKIKIRSSVPLFQTMEIKSVEKLRPQSSFPELTDDAVAAGRDFVIENKL